MNGGGLAATWVLTALFGASAIWVLLDILGSPAPSAGRPVLVDRLWHVVMGAGMIVMLWPWGAVVPVIAIVVLFTAGTCWFVGRGLFAGAAAGPFCRQPMPWSHVAMMASMVFMAVAANALSAATSATTSSTSAGMPGMAMPGMTMSGTPVVGPSGDMGAVAPDTGWIPAASAVAAVVLVVATGWSVIGEIRRGPGRRHMSESTVNGVMAVGMAAALVLMA